MLPHHPDYMSVDVLYDVSLSSGSILLPTCPTSAPYAAAVVQATPAYPPSSDHLNPTPVGRPHPPKLESRLRQRLVHFALTQVLPICQQRCSPRLTTWHSRGELRCRPHTVCV